MTWQHRQALLASQADQGHGARGAPHQAAWSTGSAQAAVLVWRYVAQSPVWGLGVSQGQRSLLRKTKLRAVDGAEGQ